MIMLESVIKADINYHPQTLLGECKYVQKKLKIENLTDDELGKSESDSDCNDERESNIDYDNKSLIMYVNHALLGFCLCQFV